MIPIELFQVTGNFGNGQLMNLLGASNNRDEFLYHATNAELAPQIMANGILPGSYWGTIEIADYYA